MATSVESGFEDVPTVGRVHYRIQVTKNFGGEVFMRMLQDVRVLSEDREIGREDPRFQVVADYLRAV